MLFFKKNYRKSGIFQGFTEWHCHVLPGVDDGVETMEESLQILSCYEELGVQQVWLTPHIMEDVPNTPSKLRQRFEQLCQSYQGPIALHLAAENMVDNLFLERLAANELLPLGSKGDHLLVETSYFNPPYRFRDILEDIKSRGYTPVLAHPERYMYMDDAYYQDLKKRGILFQLNLMSMLGYYGEPVRKKAQSLLSAGLYNLTGTDIHSYDTLLDALSDKSLTSKQVAAISQIRWG